MQKKRFQLIVFILLVLVSLGVIGLVAKNIERTTAINSSARVRNDAIISITNLSKNQVKSPDSIPVNIALSPISSQLISAISIRVSFSYAGHTKPVLTTAAINPTLISDNWSFPINTISYDEINSICTVDISGFNLATSGYPLVNVINIATITFPAGSLTFDPSFKFNTSLTKVINKQGALLKLSFSN